jgi:hypothetical protein
VPRNIPQATSAQKQFAAFRAVAEAREERPLDARGVDRFYVKQVARRVAADPGGFLALVGDKVALYWNGRELPNAEDYDFHRTLVPVLGLPLVQFGVLAPLALLGTLLWLGRGRREERLVAGLNVACCVAVVAFFVVGRYRIPGIPPLLLAATGAGRWLVLAARERRYVALGTGLVALAGFAVAAAAPRFPKSFADEEHKLALAYHLDGDLTRAERGYRASLAQGPRALAPRRNLALLLGDRGEPEWHALLFWASVRGDAPEAADARHHLGLP